MIVSNEPGYYKTGAYGIRIENLVVGDGPPRAGGEREMLGFETLTLAPIDRALVDRDLLDDGRDRLARRLPRAGARDDRPAGRSARPRVAGRADGDRRRP